MKVIKVKVFLMCLLLLFLKAYAKQNNQKSVQAYRINEPIKIDGILEETTWDGAVVSDFVQSDPIDGASPTEKTTVWVGFDENALYIAARLHDSQPDKIIARLGRRDDLVDSDWFMVAIDPYYDRRSGYQFGVNPAGSIIDMTLYNDVGQDNTWDGVWESATQINDKSWTVEMWIPFHQLRFKKKGNYVWGINFRRTIKRKNEEDTFVWIPREESGYVSHFARLEGIKDIKPGHNIELLPFTGGNAAFSPAEEGNPFQTGKDFSTNGGIDLKFALKSNLILDVSANPDFGQVEVDPAVINLTAIETYYTEKRPFFIEGANIFNFGSGGVFSLSAFDWANPSFFYSRRIGRSPQGSVNTNGYVEYPDWTTILAAAKITGKIGNGWNIGFLSALTSREFAEIDLNGEGWKEEVEPFSYYGVLRVQKEFNKGREGLGFITTSVIRDLSTGYLQDILNRNAFSLAVDGWTFLNRERTWVIIGWFGGTIVSGSKRAISHLQRSYLHYYQRPDASHVEVDEDATSLRGWAGRLYITKQGGNFIFNASLGAISPGFDSTDIGFQYEGDVFNAHIQAGYAFLHPGKVFRRWNFIFAAARNYDFGGNRIQEQLFFRLYAQLLNYWEGNIIVNFRPDRWSNRLTRGGPLVSYPASINTSFGINSDNRKPVVLSLNGSYDKGESGDNGWSASVGFRWKPRSNISLSINPGFSFNHSVAQWVSGVEDPLMTETYGKRYVFGTIDQKTLSCSIRVNWIFTPKLSLQTYIQPFIAVGAYDGYKELAQPGSFDFNIFGEANSTISYDAGIYSVDPDGMGHAPPFSFSNPDFNYKSLRGTIVLRWEYRPGSTLYAVWTQNRADYSHPGEFKFRRDFSNLLNAAGDNIFMIKFTYRFQL